MASWAIRYAASLENAYVVLSGMSNVAQMEDNISFMKEFVPLSAEERDLIARATTIISRAADIPCTGCRYCVSGEPGCPQQIPIPEYFALYNSVKQFGFLWHNHEYYQNLARDYGAPTDCITCGQCESHCPQHIEIPKRLKEVAETLGDPSNITA
jgi:predicted aldo/keto reductase-like oxidoreductase